jgi:hypothetical protein
MISDTIKAALCDLVDAARAPFQGLFTDLPSSLTPPQSPGERDAIDRARLRDAQAGRAVAPPRPIGP